MCGLFMLSAVLGILVIWPGMQQVVCNVNLSEQLNESQLEFVLCMCISCVLAVAGHDIPAAAAAAASGQH
jgi:hypothetical protein